MKRRGVETGDLETSSAHMTKRSFVLNPFPCSTVQQWRTCQALMSKTGRESMMRKISQFDPRAVPMKAAEQARKVSSAFTTDQISDASAGAATFYIWVSSVCRLFREGEGRRLYRRAG